MKALLIAEKPDLMRQIQAIYDKHKSELSYTIDFTSQRGHLLRLMNPDEVDESMKQWNWENIPYFPDEHDGWKYTIINDKKVGSYLTSKERYDIIAKGIKSGQYDFVINAGDPDQEGELLVRMVLSHANNRLPVKRFWTNDLTESHILHALKNLKDDDHDPMLVNLLRAGYARQHLDYAFGINISRAATLKMQVRVACGRVKTVILYIICKRENEIRNFKPHTTYGVKAVYEEGFDGTYFVLAEKDEASTDKKDEEKDEEKGIVWFETKKEAEDFIASLSKEAKITTYEEKEVKTYGPKQFKLATLQIEAGKRGYDDAETLAIVQSLYEKHLLSYPRTDCEFLASGEDFFGILSVLNKIPEFNPYIKTVRSSDLERVKKSKRWINDKALEESGHSALRPTTTLPDFSTLSDKEADIYKMVCRQFISMFLPPIVQKKTMLVTDINGEKFISRGKRLVDEGFSRIFGTKFTDVEIPLHKEGDILTVKNFDIPEKTSQCPKRFTSPELIAVCENPAKYLEDKSLKSIHGKKLKIGTPATRSPIIKQLITVDKYMSTKKEGKREVIVPTEIGEKIIGNLGNCDICKVDMTGEMEMKLEDVRLGIKPFEDFERDTKNHVKTVMENIKTTEMTPLGGRSPVKVVGVCPKCGKEIVDSEKGYYCRGYKKDGSGCNIKCWKEAIGTTFSLEDAMELWKGNKIKKTINFSAKTWKQEIRYNFVTNEAEYDTAPDHTITACPYCGGNVVGNELNFHCEKGCIKKSRIVCGATLADDDVENLFHDKQITVECSRDGKSWNQKLEFNKKKKQIDFVKYAATKSPKKYTKK